MKTLKVPADIGHLDEVTAFVCGSLEEWGAGKEAILQAQLACEELFVNISSYAYPDGSGDAEIGCALLAAPRRAAISFADSGTPFDPMAKEDADTSEEALMAREGGLGILLVKNMMDDMRYEYRDGKNVLTIIKNF